MKSTSRGHDTPDSQTLHLAELLDFRPDQGIIRLHGQRVVILSAAAMGVTRKELVDTLGRETAAACCGASASQTGDGGNVRELEHAIERAVILANTASIRVRDLPPEDTQTSRRRSGDDTLDLQEQERTSIERAPERFRGNGRKATEALNISTVTVWRKTKQYGLSS